MLGKDKVELALHDGDPAACNDHRAGGRATTKGRQFSMAASQGSQAKNSTSPGTKPGAASTDAIDKLFGSSFADNGRAASLRPRGTNGRVGHDAPCAGRKSNGDRGDGRTINDVERTGRNGATQAGEL